jgi:hypothetical protein
MIGPRKTEILRLPLRVKESVSGKLPAQIELPASLRSENCSPSARNAVRVPGGISAQSVFAHSEAERPLATLA